MSELVGHDIPETAVIDCDAAVETPPARVPPRPPSPPSARDRRDSVRWRCDLEVRCQCRPAVRGDGWWAGRIRNLSARGILLVGEGPPQGDTLAIEVRRPTGSIACLLLARVVHARPLAQGGWAFGCQLHTRLSGRQLRSLLL
jgi:hypothetical protein